MNHGNYYPAWQTARLNFIMARYAPEFFKDKKILELGGYNGHIAHHFSNLGAKVDCVEGREENVNYMKATFPELNAVVANLDTPDWKWGKYDIIINFGLLYHLENFHKEHLRNCINNCDLMFFESVVYDSASPELYVAHESGPDQSLSGKAGTPSTSYIENIFDEMHVKYTKHADAALNGEFHTYNWPDTFANQYHIATRRFWIVGE